MRRTALLILVVLAFCFTAFSQQRIRNGPPTLCPGDAHTILDAGNEVLYNCGFPTNPGNAPMRTDGLLTELNAPGTSTVIATATALNGSSFNIGPGWMNGLGKSLLIKAYGTYSITTGTPTLAIAVKIGSVTVATCTSSATTNAVTTFPFYLEATVTTTTVGASGADEAHCRLTVVLGGSAAAAASTFIDNNTAASSTYDHTVLNALTLVGTAAGASNAALLRSYELIIRN